jgi:hypothetical protein
MMKQVFFVMILVFSVILIYLTIPEAELEFKKLDIGVLTETESDTMIESTVLKCNIENILYVNFMFEFKNSFFSKRSFMGGSENIVDDEIDKIQLFLIVENHKVIVNNYLSRAEEIEDFEFKEYKYTIQNKGLEGFKEEYNKALNDYLHDFFSANFKHRAFVFILPKITHLKNVQAILSLEITFKSGKIIKNSKQCMVN